MKPKLVIYGDSYASVMTDFLRPHSNNNNYVWYEDSVLTENYNITNYGNPGIDFMHCYYKFIDTHSKYDNIVFTVTSANRLGFHYKYDYFRFSTVDDISIRLKTAQRRFPDDYEIHSAINSVEYYFKYYNDTAKSEAAQSKLVEKIQEIRPDTVVVYAFENSFIPASSEFNLSHLSIYKEIELLMNPDGEFWKKHSEMRNAHMTIKNNKIFANYIFDKLKGRDHDLTYDQFESILPEEKHLYFIENEKFQDILNEAILRYF